MCIMRCVTDTGERGLWANPRGGTQGYQWREGAKVFWGLKFAAWDFFGVSNFLVDFFWYKDSGKDFFGVDKNDILPFSILCGETFFGLRSGTLDFFGVLFLRNGLFGG